MNIAGNADYYDRTAVWLGSTRISAQDRSRASFIDALGKGPLHVLELGASFGSTAAALADLGHHVVAVESSPARAIFARRHLLKRQRGTLEILQDDFNSVELDTTFDVVAYWSGFGVGDDLAQLTLLQRINKWLKDDGRAFIDVFDPAWWLSVDSEPTVTNGICRRLGYDVATSRLSVSYWPQKRPFQIVTETIKCYSIESIGQLIAQARLDIIETSCEPSEHAAHSYLIVLAKQR
jgi:SAM-dependent methyltransferase